MDPHTRLLELRQERLETSTKAGQLQEELNKTIVRVHQLDGAIAALEEVVMERLKQIPAEPGISQ